MSERLKKVDRVPVTDTIELPGVDPQTMLIKGVADCPKHGEGVYFERLKVGEDRFRCAFCVRDDNGNGKPKRDKLTNLGVKRGR